MHPTTGYPYLDDGGPLLAIAHRGGALEGEPGLLENTLAAFRTAVDLGYTYLETDVHVTRDGVLVAFHDDVLDRVTDATGAIAELTWSEVGRARIGGEEPIPTLVALMDAFPSARFNIDIKAPGAIKPLAELIHERQAASRVLVGSFSGRRLRTFRRLAGRSVATSAHPLEVAAHLLLPSALARLVSQAVALQVPPRWHGVPLVTGRLVRRAHRSGLQVHVWTVNDPDEMRSLLDLGVDGLVTDRIDTLKDVLSHRGLWREGTEEP